MLITSSFVPNPFGSPMDGRTFSSDKYRFGFNGKEKDDEIQGDGNACDFGSRIYDSRLGRWLSLDPEMSKYPAISPYAFSLNSPLMFNDPDGKKAKVTIIRDPGNTGGKIIVSTIIYVTGLKKKDATEFINTMNTEASALLKPYTYTDAEGKTWEISYQITYQEGKIGALNEDRYVNNQMNAKGKHNEANITTGTSSILKDVVKGVVKGDKDAIGTALEESIHQLGFDDKYLMVLDDVTGKKTGKYAPKEGWSDDALTGPCRKNDYKFLDKNSENMGQFLESQGFLKDETITTTRIIKTFDSDKKNQELKSNLSDEQKKNISNSY